MKNVARNDDVRRTGIEPLPRVGRGDPPSHLESAGIRRQGRSGRGGVARTEHYDVTARQPVAEVHCGVRRRRTVGGEVGCKMMKHGEEDGAAELLFWLDLSSPAARPASSVSVEPTICLTWPECRSMHGRNFMLLALILERIRDYCLLPLGLLSRSTVCRVVSGLSGPVRCDVALRRCDAWAKCFRWWCDAYEYDRA